MRSGQGDVRGVPGVGSRWRPGGRRQALTTTDFGEVRGRVALSPLPKSLKVTGEFGSVTTLDVDDSAPLDVLSGQITGMLGGASGLAELNQVPARLTLNGWALRRAGTRQPGARESVSLQLLICIGLIGSMTLGGGCRKACQGPKLTLEVRRTADLSSALSLLATLSADGSPVPQAPISFFAMRTEGGRKIGTPLGDATTDAAGVARLDRRQGLQGALFADEHPSSLTAEFVPIRPIGGKQYCDARASAPL